MVLASRRRPHARQLRHGGDDRCPAQPAEQETVDQTRGSAVQQPEDKETEHCFPGHCRGAGDPEDGEGGEISLHGGLDCVFDERWGSKRAYAKDGFLAYKGEFAGVCIRGGFRGCANLVMCCCFCVVHPWSARVIPEVMGSDIQSAL